MWSAQNPGVSHRADACWGPSCPSVCQEDHQRKGLGQQRGTEDRGPLLQEALRDRGLCRAPLLPSLGGMRSPAAGPEPRTRVPPVPPSPARATPVTEQVFIERRLQPGPVLDVTPVQGLHRREAAEAGLYPRPSHSRCPCCTVWGPRHCQHSYPLPPSRGAGPGQSGGPSAGHRALAPQGQSWASIWEGPSIRGQ